jgi:hypothetical protein
MLERKMVEIKPVVIIAALNKMPIKERDSVLEDLFASTSQEYLKKHQRGYRDYKATMVKIH